MTFKKQLHCISFILIFASLSTYAQQRKKDNPLLRFFQTNFDSTIIYHSWSSWYAYPNYRIIAKKDSSIYFFIYKSPYSLTRGRFFPGNLMDKFAQEEGLFQQTLPDTNRYFTPVFINPTERKRAWANINAFNIWQAEEVTNETSKCDIYDAGENTFYLIVKDSMKVLNYYAAEYFEECGPPNLHRQNAIRTKVEILAIFK